MPCANNHSVPCHRLTLGKTLPVSPNMAIFCMCTYAYNEIFSPKESTGERERERERERKEREVRKRGRRDKERVTVHE